MPIARFLQLLLFLSVVIGGGVVWPRFMMWINQPITRVEVHSTLRYIHKSRVQSMLNPLIKSRFFQLDLQRVREVLLSQSWVKEVSLRKEWPDKLVVFLEEKEPVARWGDDSLITGDGDVFSLRNLEDFQALPVLKGPYKQAQVVMQQYLAIGQLLRPMGLVVNELDLSSTGAWSFQVNGVRVNMGEDNRAEKLQRFIRLYHARLESQWQRVGRIDLRYSNGAAVAWNNS